MIWMVLALISLFLIGTFAYTWRMMKVQSKREEAVDKSKLKPWVDDDDERP